MEVSWIDISDHLTETDVNSEWEELILFFISVSVMMSRLTAQVGTWLLSPPGPSSTRDHDLHHSHDITFTDHVLSHHVAKSMWMFVVMTRPEGS